MNRLFNFKQFRQKVNRLRILNELIEDLKEVEGTFLLLLDVKIYRDELLWEIQEDPIWNYFGFE